METQEQERTIAGPNTGYTVPPNSDGSFGPATVGPDGATAEVDGETVTLQPDEPDVLTNELSPGTPAPEPEAEAEPEAGWILRITPDHRCILPSIDDRTFVGSIWRCGGCGQDYLVYHRRGKYAGTKAFKKISAEKAAELLAKHSS